MFTIHRLQGCQKDIDVWQKILQLRNLVLTPADDVTSWIKLANLCRKSERISLAEKTLNSLLEEHGIDVDKVGTRWQVDYHSFISAGPVKSSTRRCVCPPESHVG